MPVNEGRDDYKRSVLRWTRCRDCYDGSDAIKSRGEAYLPKLGAHANNPKAYEEYKLRSLFYNAMGRTVDGLAGGIFQKPPTFTFESKTQDALKIDVTLAGVSAESFALRTTREVLTTGRYGILTDWSERQARPYWIGYQAENIVNWRTSIIGGDEILTMVTLRECAEEPDPKDPFAVSTVEQYRVLQLEPGPTPRYTQTVYREVRDSDGRGAGKWEPYSETPSADPVLVPLRRGTPLPFIPFTFATPTGTSSEIEKPPLVDLVEVNLSHYRGSADLKHGLHWAALPTPWVKGATDEKGDFTIGSSKAWVLGPEGGAGYLEVAGPGFEAIRTDQQDMQKMMATLGARLLEEQPGAAETLGAVGMRHAGEHATLRTITASVEGALTWTAQVSAWWAGTAESLQKSGAKVELNRDFFQVKASPDVVRTALLALQADRISQATFFHVLATGEWSRPGVTFEQELAEIARTTREPGPEPEPAGDAE